MPNVLAKLVKVIKNRYPWLSINSILNLTLVKVAQMFTAKRIKYVEYCNSNYPNYYAIVFMPSGAGKDRISKELDKFVFYPFREWFKCRVMSYKEKSKKQIEEFAMSKYPDENNEKQRKLFIKEKLKEVRNMIIEVSEGTREGFYTDAVAFNQAEFGSLMVKIAELGQYLNNMTNEQRLFFNTLFEAYSGIIRSKCIKGQQREYDVEDLPVNALLYSDPTMFKKKNLEEIFNTLMETGLGRRCTITFMNKKEPYVIEKDATKAYDAENKYYKDLKALGEEMFRIFDAVPLNAYYELSRETYLQEFHSYKLKLEEFGNNENNPLISNEIVSRELKALKLSTLFACINHSSDLYIKPQDMRQAIDTIEMLSLFATFKNALY